MHLASAPSRLGGLAVAAGAEGATATWTPAVERNVTGYLVQYGPPEAPERWQVRVDGPRAVLPQARAGMVVRVKAVNEAGLEGWDWAREVVR
jgi:hypothetical protein